MVRQSGRLRCQEADVVGEQNRDPPPALTNWQEMFAAMEAQLLHVEAELRWYRQHAALPAPEVEIRQAEVPVHASVSMVRERKIEPLYEQFKKKHPLTFEVGTDPLVVEGWLKLITSTLDFMGVKGSDRVTCASHVLRGDTRIWWGIVS